MREMYHFISFSYFFLRIVHKTDFAAGSAFSLPHISKILGIQQRTAVYYTFVRVQGSVVLDEFENEIQFNFESTIREC